jgi:peptidyl-prolyl cis-trans isomerase D
MALINKIRQRSGLAIGVVAIGLGLFVVGGDILGPNSAILGKNKTDVGEIAGRTIDITEYQDEIDRIKYRYTINYQRTPTENEMVTVRQQAWDYLIVKYAFEDQYEALDLRVTDEEQWDMIQGNNIRWEIQQSFTDPETGEFQRDNVIRFLQSIKNAPPNQQASWYLFEQELKPSRLRIKYDNLLEKTLYITEAEARRQYNFDNTVAEIKYLYVPYYSVNDSAVQVEDRDLRQYLSAHTEEYQVEESRDFSYVSIPVIPSAKDSAIFEEEMAELRENFVESREDSIFARINSDGATYFGRYTVDQLPGPLQSSYNDLSEGDIVGPVYEDERYNLYKISAIEAGDDFAARARHILIKWTDQSDASRSAARSVAQDLLRQLRAGADFAQLARENSQDGSAQNGGDLGWFGAGQMVAPFEEAVRNAGRPGLINQVIETQFGYHLIDVTQPADFRTFVVASIQRAILPSDETRNNAYRKADVFAAKAKDYNSFMATADTESMEVFTATEIGPMDRQFNGISNGRNVIQWAYTDAGVGDVSGVREADDAYIVAVLTNISEEGTANLETVREQLVNRVKNQKKGDIIVDELANMQGSLDDIAEAYGEDARVYTSSDLKYTSTSLPGVGFVPAAVGRAFSLEEGESTEPFKEENGVLIIEMRTITEAPEIADYSSYKNQLETRYSGRIGFGASEAIREYAGIEDRRYRYF